MTDRLTAIKARLDLAATHEWTMVENNWSTTTIYSCYSSICILQLYEEFEEDEDVETYIEDQRNTALFITHAPSDIAWLISELEKERAKNNCPTCNFFRKDHDCRKQIATVTEFRCGTETVYKDGTVDFQWSE